MKFNDDITNNYMSYVSGNTYTKPVVNKTEKELWSLSRRKGIMSDRLKEEIAKEMGIYDTVQKEGWGGIKSRDAGNMVKRAIEMAEENTKNKL